MVVSKRYEPSFKVTSLGVVLDEALEISVQQITSLGDFFNIKANKIQIMTVRRTVAQEDNAMCAVLRPKEISFFGKLPNEIEVSCAEEVDLLINMHQSNDLYLNWLSSAKKHRLSVGFLPTEKDLNDLIFAFSPQEVDILKTELKKYLQQLNRI